MTPRRDPSGTIWLAGLAVVLVALVAVWSWHHKLAAAVTFGGTLWVAGIVGGICAAAAWIEERKARGDADRRCEALEAECQRLQNELTERDLLAGKAVAVPLLSVRRTERPDLPIVPPQRDGSEYEWPAIARVLDVEEGETP